MKPLKGTRRIRWIRRDGPKRDWCVGDEAMGPSILRSRGGMKLERAGNWVRRSVVGVRSGPLNAPRIHAGGREVVPVDRINVDVEHDLPIIVMRRG